MSVVSSLVMPIQTRMCLRSWNFNLIRDDQIEILFCFEIRRFCIESSRVLVCRVLLHATSFAGLSIAFHEFWTTEKQTRIEFKLCLMRSQCCQSKDNRQSRNTPLLLSSMHSFSMFFGQRIFFNFTWLACGIEVPYVPLNAAIRSKR